MEHARALVVARCPPQKKRGKRTLQKKKGRAGGGSCAVRKGGGLHHYEEPKKNAGVRGESSRFEMRALWRSHPRGRLASDLKKGNR